MTMLTDPAHKKIAADRARMLSLPISGMTCASCSTRIGKVLEKQEGVSSASVNLATEQAAVTFDPGLVSPLALVAVVVGEIGVHVARAGVACRYWSAS